jgi:hypothetical protein
MIPGSNLLAQALTVIASQTVIYFAATGRTVTATRREVTAFAPGVSIASGSVQAVARDRYEAKGLDYAKSYVTWFVPNSVLGVARDRAADEFAWNGRRYGVESVTPWFAQDGWSEVLGIDKGPAS